MSGSERVPTSDTYPALPAEVWDLILGEELARQRILDLGSISKRFYNLTQPRLFRYLSETDLKKPALLEHFRKQPRLAKYVSVVDVRISMAIEPLPVYHYKSDSAASASEQRLQQATAFAASICDAQNEVLISSLAFCTNLTRLTVSACCACDIPLVDDELLSSVSSAYNPLPTPLQCSRLPLFLHLQQISIREMAFNSLMPVWELSGFADVLAKAPRLCAVEASLSGLQTLQRTTAPLSITNIKISSTADVQLLNSFCHRFSDTLKNIELMSSISLCDLNDLSVYLPQLECFSVVLGDEVDNERFVLPKIASLRKVFDMMPACRNFVFRLNESFTYDTYQFKVLSCALSTSQAATSISSIICRRGHLWAGLRHAHHPVPLTGLSSLFDSEKLPSLQFFSLTCDLQSMHVAESGFDIEADHRSDAERQYAIEMAIVQDLLSTMSNPAVDCTLRIFGRKEGVRCCIGFLRSYQGIVEDRCEWGKLAWEG